MNAIKYWEVVMSLMKINKNKIIKTISKKKMEERNQIETNFDREREEN